MDYFSFPGWDFRGAYTFAQAVVGGGLGGLALAVGLQQRGFDVQVYGALSQAAQVCKCLFLMRG